MSHGNPGQGTALVRPGRCFTRGPMGHVIGSDWESLESPFWVQKPTSYSLWNPLTAPLTGRFGVEFMGGNYGAFDMGSSAQSLTPTPGPTSTSAPQEGPLWVAVILSTNCHYLAQATSQPAHHSGGAQHGRQQAAAHFEQRGAFGTALRLPSNSLPVPKQALHGLCSLCTPVEQGLDQEAWPAMYHTPQD